MLLVTIIKGLKMEIHDYDVDDYLLMVNGQVWAVSGNTDFFDMPELEIDPIPDGADVTIVKVVANEYS
tara:strand:- start:1508 stop:1711 length:204 start_codon:yes stop_codon:yes gene_type:complete